MEELPFDVEEALRSGTFIANFKYEKDFWFPLEDKWMPKIEKTCEECNQRFLTMDSKRKFCSVACSSKAHWKNPDYRDKVILGNKGKERSEEFKTKMSRIWKQRWQDPSLSKRIRERFFSSNRPHDIALLKVLEDLQRQGVRAIPNGLIGFPHPDIILFRDGEFHAIEIEHVEKVNLGKYNPKQVERRKEFLRRWFASVRTIKYG